MGVVIVAVFVAGFLLLVLAGIKVKGYYKRHGGRIIHLGKQPNESEEEYQKRIRSILSDSILSRNNNLLTVLLENLDNSANWKNHMGYTALSLAVMNNNEKAVDILLRHKADISIKNEDETTVRDHITERTHKGIKNLIDNNIPVQIV